MKTLIIVSHPNIDDSKINKAWIAGVEKSDYSITVHNINNLYPDGVFDIKKEQDLIIQHDAIIFQFPFYWFNLPPLLKQWLDDILLPGFAYGSNDEERKMTGMPIGIAVSTGIKSEDYTNSGRYKYTVKELLSPLHATASYIGAKALEPYIFYGAEYSPSANEIAESVQGYEKYVASINAGVLREFSY